MRYSIYLDIHVHSSIIYNIPRAAIPAPARAPKYGTLVGAAPALLAELLALADELAADELAEDAALAPLEVALAAALAAEEVALETAELMDEALFGAMDMELIDWAAARPAKRRVIEKRMLILVLLLPVRMETPLDT
jgi:hypothetical protein